jgi:sulfur carrier protein ThiS
LASPDDAVEVEGGVAVVELLSDPDEPLDDELLSLEDEVVLDDEVLDADLEEPDRLSVL